MAIECYRVAMECYGVATGRDKKLGIAGMCFCSRLAFRAVVLASSPGNAARVFLATLGRHRPGPPPSTTLQRWYVFFFVACVSRRGGEFRSCLPIPCTKAGPSQFCFRVLLEISLRRDESLTRSSSERRWRLRERRALVIRP